MTRRHALAAGCVAVGGIVAGALSRPSSDDGPVATARRPRGSGEVARRSESLLDGTDHETTLYEIDASEAGPTAMVFGGVHGDERNGIAVAHEMVEWHPDAGTLVVIPETNRVAIENEERDGVGGDLNRQFPLGDDPQTELARGIWDALERYDPDVVCDLHRSLGISGLHHQYVGQMVFYSPGACGPAVAGALNDAMIPWYTPLHRFRASLSDINGPLLFQAANRELGAMSYLLESTSFVLDEAAMIRHTRFGAAKVLEVHGLIESEGGR
ncbi:succinylglutamate desuccinylase/aspartoacylase family protein [Halostagnicola kamekurae]|uniref:Succinylglutamate desuccinylase / Aspartoacylase family protein n=1 Tax=Halostagnicola kamekurae TaxID=619731 RepID=A0A1I6P342_9EURY|nr:succinylglutamate desuccinylase/aspartoacylase family protein [Halostagnicola kamekurae]SFS34624.1 Succinylglutamate desuccinylase / Aspartoacylase family protein [Halostagnicola kamekurae]